MTAFESPLAAALPAAAAASATAVRVLHLEDNPDDAALVLRQLQRAGLRVEVRQVAARQAFCDALEQFRPDIVLSDYRLPDFDGSMALAVVRKAHPEIPVILVSGALSDLSAVELLKAGAHDFILKDRLARLAPSVIRALDDARRHRDELAARVALERSEARMAALMANVSEAIVVLSPSGEVRFVSAGVRQITGHREEEVVGRTMLEFVHPEDRARAMQDLKRLLEGGGPLREQYRLLARNGGERIGEISASNLTQVPALAGIVVVVRDVSERVAAEGVRHRLAAMIEGCVDAVIGVSADGRISDWNAAAQHLLGYTTDEAVGQPVALLFPPGACPVQADRIQEKTPAGSVHSDAGWSIRKDGSAFEHDLTLSPIRDAQGTFVGITAVLRDVTERNRSARALQRVTCALQTLRAADEVLLHATSEAQLLEDTSQALARVGGFPTVLIAYARDDAAGSVEAKASIGFNPCALAPPLSWHDNEHGQMATSLALRTGKPQLVRNLRDNPGHAPWREQVAAAGLGTVLALPLILSGMTRPLGVLSLAVHDRESFDADELELMGALAANLAHGIGHLRAEDQRRAAERKLRAGLEGAVAAIGATMEARDPYTAGHQRRVAEFAVAIAREMGLSPERQEGIRFGALIHDVGKIVVPAEILAKPSRLTRFEFEIIKAHPQVGYDIVKGIDFPWPIAEMVHQHHERLDGSGYPRGLKGDEIAPDARILSVADVVEAMASHRPYRPGLGIEAALREIESHKGDWFDPAVVDACLRLFREKHFTL